MTMSDLSSLSDRIYLDRGAARRSLVRIEGRCVAELFDERGRLKERCESRNLVTAVGDQLYSSRGAGLTTSAVPLGMKLGTGSTAPAKTGAGAALAAYLSNSHQAFDATFPSAAGGVVTYKVSYPAGKATSASPITEAVIFTDALADATSTAANTPARVLLSGIGGKGVSDTLALTWTHTLLGS